MRLGLRDLGDGADTCVYSSTNLNLSPGAHAAANLGPLLGLENFVGLVEITSSVPIISVSLNAEAFPVFSPLPPGELNDSATLVFQ